jgi:peptide/nickel transport system substrate-binding protein
LKDAGYVEGSTGMLEKNGTPLKITLAIKTADAKLGEVLQQQYKALGVQLDIKAEEVGVLIADLLAGKFELSWMGFASPNANILNTIFNSKNIGAYNVHRVNDPDVDALLNRANSTNDAATRTEAFNEVQRIVVEKAYIIPLYASKRYSVLRSRIKGAVFSTYDVLTMPFFNDAYIETK